MTKAEAIVEVQRMLGFRTDQSNNIVLSLQRAQRLLELGQSLPWFLIQEDETLGGLPDTGYVDLPMGFIREVEDEPWYFTSTGTDNYVRRLRKVAYDHMLDLGRNAVTDVADNEDDRGASYFYSIRKTQIFVRPIPTAIWSLRGSYYKAADSLGTENTNVWLTYAPEVLYGSAAMAMARDLRDDYGYATAEVIFKEGNARLMADTIMREQGNREYVMGGQA